MPRFLTTARWSVLDFIMSGVALASLAIWMLNPIIGRVEGFLDPVVSDFRVETVMQAGEHQSRIWGAFEIERLPCEFRAIEWEITGRDRDGFLSLVFEDGEHVREGRSQTFGPWLIGVPPDVIGRTRANVIHQCPGRPWLTVTPIYP